MTPHDSGNNSQRKTSYDFQYRFQNLQHAAIPNNHVALSENFGGSPVPRGWFHHFLHRFSRNRHFFWGVFRQSQVSWPSKSSSTAPTSSRPGKVGIMGWWIFWPWVGHGTPMVETWVFSPCHASFFIGNTELAASSVGISLHEWRCKTGWICREAGHPSLPIAVKWGMNMH